MKPASEEQNKIMDNYEGHVCAPFLHRGLVSADNHSGFLELYDMNIEHARDTVNEASRFTNEYARVHSYGGEREQI